MEINKDKVRLFISSDFGAIIGEYEDRELNTIKLKYPFRLVQNQQGNLSVAAIFHKEEWVKINISNCLEINVSDALMDVYEKYCNSVHSIIYVPDDKKVIL